MTLRVYVIIEEGSDRVYVQQSYPAWYERPKDRASQILAVDIPITFTGFIDGKILLSPGQVMQVE
jgi:hypothetical protein